MALVRTQLIATKEQQFFYILAGLAGFLVVLYCYFLGTSIYNAILIEETGNQTALVTSRVSELEAVYFSRKQDISLAFAYDLGFVDLPEKEYVAKKSTTAGVLSVNAN